LCGLNPLAHLSVGSSINRPQKGEPERHHRKQNQDRWWQVSERHHEDHAEQRESRPKPLDGASHLNMVASLSRALGRRRRSARPCGFS